MKKYIFIDFDGVLVSDDYIRDLTSEGKESNDEFGALFNPQCLSNLQAIVNKTGAKIVISSSWKEYGKDLLEEMWAKRNIAVEFHSITPSLLITSYLDQISGNSFNICEFYSKGLEINAWLEKNASKDCNYCIIDDECYFLAEQLSHLVKVNPHDGLTELDAVKVVEILNKE